MVKAKKIDEAKNVLAEIKTLAENTYIKPYFLAMAHTALGNFEEAIPLFQQSIDEDDPWMLWFGTEPMLEDFRQDTRFQKLLAQMKHSQ